MAGVVGLLTYPRARVPRLRCEYTAHLLPHSPQGHRIYLTFNDGTSKTVDFQPWLEGPIFEPLGDQRYFRQFFVAGSTVCWPNGADIAPETLYAATDIRQVA